MQAWKLIKENGGSAGVDQQSIADFEKNLKDNLYKIWNRMSSGTYFPPPVKAVPIPKKSGGERILGVPSVSDRVAQMVVKLIFEPCVEPHFLPDSYGYRPKKSALDAVGVTRTRCWKYDWVVEFDIKGLFDNIDHDLLMKAVRKHTDNKLVLLYIERWLKTPMQFPDGSLQEKTKGTMQGGVISPVLSNLFLHYVFDCWMTKQYPNLPWCRYADDGLVHCNTEQQAKEVFDALKKRFEECLLEMHPTKSKIVYCKDDDRRDDYPNTKFTFLGYDFRRRSSKNSKNNKMFLNFTPAVSNAAKKSMRAKTKETIKNIGTYKSLNDIADKVNPILQGWINYYGKYNKTALCPVFRHLNLALVRWIMRKFKRFKGYKTKAAIFLEGLLGKQPTMFAHWKAGLAGGFA
jgi:group II intron reverse transcriptase/maturase